MEPTTSAPLRIRQLPRDEFEALAADAVPYVRKCVLTMAGASLRSREAVSDIVQSAVRVFLGARDSYMFIDMARHRRYLWRVTTNKIFEKVRAQQFRHSEEYVDSTHEIQVDLRRPRGEEAPPALAILAEDLTNLQVAMDDLDDRDRQILTMRNILELTWGEIASEVGLPEATVRYRHALAIGTLASALGPQRD